MSCTVRLMLLFALGLVFGALVKCATWEEWWTYAGMSGPEYWGVLNPAWNLCNSGHRQSPVDIQLENLLFDPLLGPLHVSNVTTGGRLHNTGRLVAFRPDHRPWERPVTISGGPLLYTYQLAEIHLRHGSVGSVGRAGSEHSVGCQAFPAEIQIYGFNSDLYHNFSEAEKRPQGIVVIALMVEIGEESAEIFEITKCLSNVTYKDSACRLESLSLRRLLLETDDYLTYEGSVTYPGCWETATWVLPNRPLYISSDTVQELGRLVQGYPNDIKGPLGGKRSHQPINGRPVRSTVRRERPGTQTDSDSWPGTDWGANPVLRSDASFQLDLTAQLIDKDRIYAHQCSTRCSIKVRAKSTPRPPVTSEAGSRPTPEDSTDSSVLEEEELQRPAMTSEADSRPTPEGITESSVLEELPRPAVTSETDNTPTSEDTTESSVLEEELQRPAVTSEADSRPVLERNEKAGLPASHTFP